MRRIVWLDDGALLQWDRFVEQHRYGGLFQTSTWKGVLESSFPHIHGRFCALVDGSTGEIQAGMPIYAVRSWLLGDRLVSVPFATLCDPLISSPEELSVILPEVRRWLQTMSGRFSEIRTHRSSAMFHESGMRSSQSYLHHFIRLDRSEEAIRMNFGRTAVRQMITKAANHGIKAVPATTLVEMETFHALLSETRRRLGLPPIPVRFFQVLWNTYGGTKHLTLLLGHHNGTIIGGVLALKWRDTFSLEYEGDDGRFRKSGLVQLLYWEAMKLAMREGYASFSMGRTYRGNKGLLQSKGHWGLQTEELCTFFYPTHTHKDAEDREASFQYRLIKLLARRLPPRACRTLGNFCYRHMG